MAQNVTIAGNSYPDVPAVSIPKTGGGLATFYDASGIDYAGSPTSGGNANMTNAILYGRVDSTSTSTVFTATVAGLEELVDGTCVMLHNGVVTSAANFTVNINNLGAKKCYNNLTNATQDTTIFNIAYTMMFVYASDLDEGNGGFWIYRGYDGNTNTIGYQVRTNSGNKTASDTGYRYRIWLTSADGSQWVPINTSTSTNATTARSLNTRAIDPFGPIIYRATNGTCNSGAGIGATGIWQQYVLSIGYSYMASGFSLAFPDSVYLKCTPNADGSATMNSIVQALPSSKDGKIYIYLGTAYSATNMELEIFHPVYWHDGTGIRAWTGAEGGGSTVTVTQSLSSGTQVGSISVDGTATALYAPTPPTASTTAPSMDGTASYGSGTSYARSNHVHPTDTSRQATLVSGTNIKTVNSTSLLGSGDISVQPTLVSGTNIKTVNNESLLGSGNITIGGSSNRISSSDSTSGGAMASAYVQTLADASYNEAIIQMSASYMGSGGTPYDLNTLCITSDSVTINDNPIPTMQTATATLPTSGWTSDSITVNVTGVTASNNVIVSPAPTSVADWASCGIYCSAQGSGTLTFTCTTVPSSALTANVLILG